MWVSIDKRKTGDNLKHLFRKHDYTVQEIASELNVNQNSVYRWCYGGGLPNYESMIALSEILGEPIDEIIVYDVRY